MSCIHTHLVLFFFTATAPTEIYTRSLHDALPISVNTITPTGVVPVGGGIIPTAPVYTGSDIRLKKNIKLIGRSNSGLKIYSFEYIDKKYGSHTYQGVMSSEVPKEAVIKDARSEERRVGKERRSRWWPEH